MNIYPLMLPIATLTRKQSLNEKNETQRFQGALDMLHRFSSDPGVPYLKY